jgi:GGDEF domain-containing protein
MVFRDISAERRQTSHIKYLSYHDSLTGLYNRRYIEENLKIIDIPENLPLSVIMGDVNGLKITNDVFGHEAGDKLLKYLAESLNRFSSEKTTSPGGAVMSLLLFCLRQAVEAEKS